MKSVSVRDLFAGIVPVGSDVTLKGWVRTRRDSKQGFSFINLHDGSCFDAIQVVADKALPNYEKEILRLTTGCAIVAKGAVVESTGKGQKFEIQAKLMARGKPINSDHTDNNLFVCTAEILKKLENQVIKP